MDVFFFKVSKNGHKITHSLINMFEIICVSVIGRQDEKDTDIILNEDMKIAGLKKDVMSPW